MKKEKTAERRIGAKVNLVLYQKLCKIAQIFGRSKSDLLKEGIWEVINAKGGSYDKNK